MRNEAKCSPAVGRTKPFAVSNHIPGLASMKASGISIAAHCGVGSPISLYKAEPNASLRTTLEPCGLCCHLTTYCCPSEASIRVLCEPPRIFAMNRTGVTLLQPHRDTWHPEQNNVSTQSGNGQKGQKFGSGRLFNFLWITCSLCGKNITNVLIVNRNSFTFKKFAGTPRKIPPKLLNF